MEDQDSFRDDAMEAICLRNLDIRGRAVATFVLDRMCEPPFSYLSAEALAVVLEATAASLSIAAEVLRRGGVRE